MVERDDTKLVCKYAPKSSGVVRRNAQIFWCFDTAVRVAIGEILLCTNVCMEYCQRPG